MEQTLQRIEQKLAEIEAKINTVYQSSERMRKYFLWMLIIAVAAIVLPLLILPFVIPSFLNAVSIPEGF